MRRIRRPRLTYANAVASLALFVALGGTGYAATQLAPNSVGTAQLRRGAVTAAKIDARTRRALKGRRGATGPAGTSGPAGARGATGLAGANGVDGAPGVDGAVSGKIAYVIGPVPVPRNSASLQIVGAAVPGPGKYVAIAKLDVTPSGPDEITCGLTTAQGSPGGFDVSGVTGDGVEQTMSLMFAGDFAAPLLPQFAGFYVYCNAPAGTSASVKQAKITLIQTSSVSIVPG